MTIKDIEKAVTKLASKELMNFRAWFYKFDDLAWEKQLEKDIKAGKLDQFAEKAKDDFENGRCKKL